MQSTDTERLVTAQLYEDRRMPCYSRPLWPRGQPVQVNDLRKPTTTQRTNGIDVTESEHASARVDDRGQRADEPITARMGWTDEPNRERGVFTVDIEVPQPKLAGLNAASESRCFCCGVHMSSDSPYWKFCSQGCRILFYATPRQTEPKSASVDADDYGGMPALIGESGATTTSTGTNAQSEAHPLKEEKKCDTPETPIHLTGFVEVEYTTPSAQTGRRTRSDVKRDEIASLRAQVDELNQALVESRQLLDTTLNAQTVEQAKSKSRMRAILAAQLTEPSQVELVEMQRARIKDADAKIAEQADEIAALKAQLAKRASVPAPDEAMDSALTDLCRALSLPLQPVMTAPSIVALYVLATEEIHRLHDKNKRLETELETRREPERPLIECLRTPRDLQALLILQIAAHCPEDDEARATETTSARQASLRELLVSERAYLSSDQTFCTDALHVQPSALKGIIMGTLCDSRCSIGRRDRCKALFAEEAEFFESTVPLAFSCNAAHTLLQLDEDECC